MTDTRFDALQPVVSDWLRTCELPNGAGFVMSHKAMVPTLMALSFAILTFELFELLPDPRSARWETRLKSAQDPRTGLFIDPYLNPADVDDTGPGFDYVVYQTTYFALAALDALCQRPDHDLDFALSLARDGTIGDWLEELDWSQPWAASNWVMFVATPLYAAWQWHGTQVALDALHSALDWLDARQDPNTGFWGIREDVPRSHAMAVTYHFLPYYFCLGRELHYVDEMVDNTLALQAEDGLFHPDGGGDTCLDVDAIDILVKCSLLTPHRADDVEHALHRAHVGLLESRAEDGGFCRARTRPLPARTWKRRVGEALGLDRLLGKPYNPPDTVRHYSGWRAMPFDTRKSDLWSTWFRPFGLALISARYPDKYPEADRWQFRNLPALGWHGRTPEA